MEYNPTFLEELLSSRFIYYLVLQLLFALYGCIYYKRLTHPYRLLVQLLIITFITEIITRWYGYHSENSSPIYHLYLPIILFYQAFIYRLFYQKARFIVPLAILAVIASIWLSFYHSIFSFPSLNVSLLALYVISNSLFLFLYIMRNVDQESILKKAVFWFNSGNLIFYGSTFCVYSVFDMMVGKANSPLWRYDLIYYANILLYLSYGIALFLNRREFSIKKSERFKS